MRFANDDAHALLQNDMKYEVDELAPGAGTRGVPRCH
jgi:hypothetical protein